MSKTAYRTYRSILRSIAPVLLNMQVRGHEHVPESGPAILVSNHISTADPPVLLVGVKRQIHFIIKVELYDHLIYRLGLPPLDVIPVRRGKVDREALRAAEGILVGGGLLGIFPEGTRSRSAETQAAHSGMIFLAQRTDAPIVPVAISGTEQIFPGRFPWFRRARVRVEIGAPFTLADLQSDGKLDREALAHAVMGRVAALLPPRYRGIYAR